jgi:hypothetical protein
MVLIRAGLSYPEFYKLMSEMDICVPAFSVDHGYYDDQASSTFAMAAECNVGPTSIFLTGILQKYSLPP